MAAERIVPPQQLEEEEIYLAPQWKLVWWRFKRHRLALVAAGLLSIFFLIAIFPNFLSIHDPKITNGQDSLVGPQRINGLWKLEPYVYDLKTVRNPETFALEHTPDKEKKIPVNFFHHGQEYRLLWLFKTDIHLMGIDTEDGRPFYPLGTDGLGRDQWSRLGHGIRMSLSVGMVGMLISLVLGVLLGGISGYAGGWVDIAIQRLIEFIISIPQLPLWILLAALVPSTWGIVQVYFAITTIISLLGWTGMARVVRGRFLSLREEEFVTAARLAGAREGRIIFRHMLPLFVSHIIASVTLTVPAIIIAETSLSFLGIGLREPAISLGVMLVAAQRVRTIALNSWLLLPGLVVIVIILSFNFIGDGLRDAADPYGRRG
jgi:peptide/nickel transport system permease protein